MGFRFRKSFGKGPFRINISKSGIGYSVGVKGARITKTAKGTKRTTLSLPGTGLSYVSETSGNRKRTSHTTSTPVSVSHFDNHTNTKGTSNLMKSGINIVKKILLWGLAIIFLSGGFVYFPSVSGILAFILVALILPIQKWQDIISKVLNGKVRVIVAIVLAIAMFATIPATPEVDGDVTANAPAVTTTNIPETTATPTPTASPTPTVTPTTKPTEAPTATPYVAPTSVPVLKVGSKGQSVVELQERLIELGYLDGSADGDFDNGIKKAVIEFQKNNNLPADGVAGEATLSVLFSKNAVRQRWVWVPTNGGTKYHSKSSCSSMENPKKITYREAIELGYDFCKKCH